MNGVAFGVLIMFVHVTLPCGLTGGNICRYNDTQTREESTFIKVKTKSIYCVCKSIVPHLIH